MTARTNEWFDAPDPTRTTDTGELGLRFDCTSCGNCCSGPSGYVRFSASEACAMARVLGITEAEFYERYTIETREGRSLREVRPVGVDGYDCVFLDRDSVPGKALCSVYGARPTQCRTWPFWGSSLTSRRAWRSAAKGCPGMNTGPLHEPRAVRLTRERDEIAQRDAVR